MVATHLSLECYFTGFETQFATALRQSALV